MKTTLLRTLARQSARWAGRLCPPAQSDWAKAIAAELDSIASDREALSYALGGLWAITRFAAWDWATPRRTGTVCGSLAALLGCAVMARMGAPSHYVALQVAALLLAWGTLALLPLRAPHAASSWVVLGAGLALLATVLFGVGARWIAMGPLHVQPSLVLLPLMVVLWAARSNRATTLGMALAALALALQADVVLATALLAALLPAVRRAPTRPHLGLLAVAIAAWAWAAYSGVPGRAAPFVDGVVMAAFGSSALEGLLLCLALLALAAPGLRHPTGASFGLFWGVLAALALLCGSATPLVGFGGSAVLGYFLSVGGLSGKEPACAA